MPEISQDELREEREIEADEQDYRRESSQRLRIHAAGHLRPPEVHAGQERPHHSSHHDVVEVRHDEVGLGQMDVQPERCEEDACQPADGKQADEAEARASAFRR